jgi:hypothetical protein
MTDPATDEAARPNPALEPFEALVGAWTTVATHPMLPGTVFHGRTTFRWLEQGAFLVMHSEFDEPGVPSAVAVFGTDDTLGQCHMLYFDERGVSRRYDVALREGVWTWKRDAPGFAQRFTGRIADDGATIDGMGELCRDGTTWEKDLAVRYTRIDPASQ